VLTAIPFSLPREVVAEPDGARRSRADGPNEIAARPQSAGTATEAAKAVSAYGHLPQWLGGGQQHDGSRQGDGSGTQRRQHIPNTDFAIYGLDTDRLSSGVATLSFRPLLGRQDPRAGITFSVLV